MVDFLYFDKDLCKLLLIIMNKMSNCTTRETDFKNAL